MIADLTNFWVVASRVSVACALLSLHLLLRSSGVMLKCRLDNKNVLGSIDENYRVITLILKKNGNLPLCLENYALF